MQKKKANSKNFYLKDYTRFYPISRRKISEIVKKSYNRFYKKIFEFIQKTHKKQKNLLIARVKNLYNG